MTARLLPTKLMQPEETRTLTFEFGEKLAIGDSLAGPATVDVVPSGTLASSAAVVSGTRVLVRLAGGTNGADYAVNAEVATTLGDLLRLSATVQVREGAN